MSRRKQAKPRSLKRGEWDENSSNIEMGLQDSPDDISRLEKVSDATGDDGGSYVAGEEGDSHESNPVYRCESCGLRLESLKRFMDHRNFECVAGVEDALIVDATHGEPEEARVTMETENSLESDVTTRDPTSWQSDTPDDQSLSPSSCPTPTDPDIDLNYTIGTTESTPYACQFCDKAFPRLSYLKRHEQSHGDQMPFKCDFCHRLFKHKRSRDRHVKLHTGDKKYRCPHCDSAFSRRCDHLKIHMKTHDNAKPFQCTICNRGYNTPAALTSHMQNHKKDAFGPLNFRCMQCTAIFQTSHQLQDHISTHSSDSASPVLDKGVQCPLCPHLVTKQESLSSHIEQVHSGETLKCHLCAESLSSLENFRQHMKIHNDTGNSEMEMSKTGNIARLTCMYCTKDSFTSLESLQLHVQAMHNSLVNGELPTSSTAPTNDSPSTSPGLPATQPPSISTPLRNLSPSSSTALQGQLNCEYCTMKFTSIQALQKHTLSVHSFTDVLSSCPDFVCCAHCTMAFGNSTALSEHIQFVHEFSSAPNRNTSSPRTSAATSTSKDPPVSTPSKSTKPSKSHRSHMNATRASSPSSSTTNSGVSNINSTTSGNIKLNSSNGECHQFTHPGTLLCNQCNAAFPDFEAFRTHLKTHLDEVVQKYICSECQGEFTSEEQLDSHVIGHYLSTTTEYGCQSCLKLFSKPDELQKHLMDIHAHHLYRCSLCKEVFDSKVSVQVHFAVKHSNECKLFKCTSCSSVFRSEMEFQLHVKVAHLRKAQPFRCLFCNFSYSSELELQCHLTTHKKQFACTLCDEAFHVEFLLDRHMQNKHAAQTSPVPADNTLATVPPTPSSSGDVTSSMSPSSTIATTGTSASNSNNNNNNSSSANKGKTKAARSPNTSSSSIASASPNAISLPKKELKCDICDAEFLSEVSLNGHRRQAHNIRVSGSQKSTQQILSLYCAYCNEACKSRTELENHMKVHTVSCGKHKCNICDEVCPTATTLAEHKLTHCKVVSGSMCVTCKVNLKSEDQYYSHLQQHNSQGLPLPCVVCRQTLMSEIEVQMHVKFHLKNAEPLFPCCICLKQFEAMNLIRNGPANGAQSYICKECFHRNTSSGVSPLSDEVVRCSECKVKFESILELEKHRAVHKKTYQCIKCQMSFDTESEIQLHVASHMLNEGTSHECQLCHQVFDSPAKLQCHLIEHTFEGCGSYSCYMCSAVFTTACLLQQHMLEHGLNSRPYDCSRCHQRFFFRAEFENHLFTHGTDPLHLGDGTCSGDISEPSSVVGLESKTSSSTAPSTGALLDELQCSDCLRTFASVVNLTNHRKIHQQKSTSYKCSLCTEMFTSTVDMQQHYFKAHNDAELNRSKKTYCCTECGKEFPCLSNLQGHLRIHTQGTKYVCPECNKEFALARNLGIHMRSHSGEKPYECPICKKRFARKENRKAHLKSHSGVKPFMCPHCGKTFSRKCHVKEHMRIHVNTPKACEICLETVTSIGALHKHMIEVHNKEFHNECKICSEPFDHPRKLKRHMKRVHGVVQDSLTEEPDLGSETSPASLSSESGDTNDFDNSECSSILESEGSRATTPVIEKKEVSTPCEDMDCD